MRYFFSSDGVHLVASRCRPDAGAAHASAVVGSKIRVADLPTWTSAASNQAVAQAHRHTAPIPNKAKRSRIPASSIIMGGLDDSWSCGRVAHPRLEGARTAASDHPSGFAQRAIPSTTWHCRTQCCCTSEHPLRRAGGLWCAGHVNVHVGERQCEWDGGATEDAPPRAPRRAWRRFPTRLCELPDMQSFSDLNPSRPPALLYTRVQQQRPARDAHASWHADNCRLPPRG